MSEIFISYARSTERKARQIAEALRALGYGVWRDDDLPAHRPYADVIEERLKAARAVVVAWSAEAVKSQWVRAEAEVAREAGTLVQLSLDGATPPLPFNQIQCADLVGWAGEPQTPGWMKVVASIADLAGEQRGAPTTPTSLSAPAGRVGICVLPFANMSGDPEQDYFSDGVSEDIITDLSKVTALSVVARNTAFTFKGRSVKVPEVARELGVSHVLEGSVRKAGHRVRITAQLIDGAAGDHVWAERYDRDLTDIFALQDEISRAIVTALKLKLLPEEKQAIEKRGTSSPEAYDLYLMARQHRERGNTDARRFETIIRFCARAIAIDPTYAQAWTLMGGAQMGLFYIYGGDNDAGAAAIARALRIDPNLAEARAVRARQLDREGRHDEALAELELALRLDAAGYDVNFSAGLIYYENRRFAEAARCLEIAAAQSETDFFSPGVTLSALAALGDHEGARRLAQLTLSRVERALAQDRTNGAAMAKGVLALATLGERERAREWIDRALIVDPDNENMRYSFACTLALPLQDVAAALDLLEPLLAGGQTERVRVASTDPQLDPLREDRRFQAMMASAAALAADAKPVRPS